MSAYPSDNLLDIQDLNVVYHGSQKSFHAIHDINISVGHGEFVAVVGQSGSGKSTTAHSIIDLLPYGTQRIAKRLQFNGRDIGSLPEIKLRTLRGKEIGFVPQDPTTSLDPVKTIGSQIVEALVVHNVLRGLPARNCAIELLDAVGIDRPSERFDQYPHEISGGMRQRVLIAIALSCEPALIIADEPTSGLDVTVQKTVLDRMAKLTKERGTAVLFITHDLGIAADRADRIVVMNAGYVVESGNARDVLFRPTAAYTRGLLGDIPPRPTALKKDFSTPDLFVVSEMPSPILEATGLTKEFKRGWFSNSKSTKAVQDVSIQLHKGKTLALVGESGSGKTTTARMLAGLAHPTEGKITLNGIPVRDKAGRLDRRVYRRIQYVYQSPFTSLPPTWRIEDIIRDPLKVNRIGDRRSQTLKVAELAEALALPFDLLKRSASELSGGQLQRVAIARALALDPDILILDEPTSALDVTIQARILALLQELQRERGLSYLFVTHDLAVVNVIADNVAVMKSGRLIEVGSKAQVLQSPRNIYTQTLIQAVPGKHLPTNGTVETA